MFHHLPPYPSHPAQFSREHPHYQVLTYRESVASSPGKGLLCRAACNVSIQLRFGSAEL